MVQITFRKIDPTQALKTRVETRVNKLFKFVSYPMEVHVFVGVDKLSHSAEVKCHAEHRDLIATAKSRDLYTSIDMVCHKIEAQLKKERERRKGHTSARLASRKSGLRKGQDVGAEIPHKEKVG